MSQANLISLDSMNEVSKRFMPPVRPHLSLRCKPVDYSNSLSIYIQYCDSAN